MKTIDRLINYCSYLRHRTGLFGAGYTPLLDSTSSFSSSSTAASRSLTRSSVNTDYESLLERISSEDEHSHTKIYFYAMYPGPMPKILPACTTPYYDKIRQTIDLLQARRDRVQIISSIIPFYYIVLPEEEHICVCHSCGKLGNTDLQL
jgi:hypothetical protein